MIDFIIALVIGAVFLAFLFFLFSIFKVVREET